MYIVLINGMANQHKNILAKKQAQKVNYFVGFCHDHLTTMSTHLQVYRYSLFESGMKTGL